MKQIGILILVCVCFCAGMQYQSGIEYAEQNRLYTLDVEVYSEVNGTVLFQDENDNLWMWDGRVNGDSHVLLMDTMGTNSRIDDEIIDVR